MGSNIGEELLKPPTSSVSCGGEDQPIVVTVPSVQEDGRSKPSWFTPKRLLVVFCVINMLNYVDRGVIASNGVNGSRRTCTSDGVCKSGTGIQGDFELSNTRDGFLSSAFMIGLIVASPIFASLAKSFNPFRLIGIGLTVWTIATAGCGASVNFLSIVFARMFVGVGEASFISLAAPFIDDNAPVAQKTVWLAAFYMCIPTGIALGYVYGGLVASHVSWRYAFFGEAILMVPFVILGFVIKPLQMKGFYHEELLISQVKDDTRFSAVKLAANGELNDSTQNIVSPNNKVNLLYHISRLWKDVKGLGDKVYVVNVLGYISYTFVVGAYSYWGPKAGGAIYHMKNPDMWFGGVTIVCGILGTLAGGFILDWMNSTVRNAFTLVSGVTLLGAVFCFIAFCLKNMYGFIALFAVGELLVFAAQAPVNYICLHCVKPSLRPLAMALSTVLIHVLGDIPSPPLVGFLQDHINNWRETALILTSIFGVASALWFVGIFLHSVDKSTEVYEHQMPSEEPSKVSLETPKSAVP